MIRLCNQSDTGLPGIRFVLSVCFWAICYFFVFCGLCPAQQVWVRVYETEEDLWESFQEGEITEEQWRDLLAFFRVGTDSVFQPSSDLEELPGYGGADTLAGLVDRLTEVQKRTPDRWWRGISGQSQLRWGYTLPLREETAEEGYLIGRSRSDWLRFYFNARSKDGRLDGFRKRGIDFSVPVSRLRVTFGNFEPRHGLGLVVGRRDRILGRTEAKRLSGSIWQPNYSNYNGIHLQGSVGDRLHVASLVSRIESPGYREDIAAVLLKLGGFGGGLDVGLAGMAGTVDNRGDGVRFRCSGAGTSVSWERGPQKLLIELALTDDGAIAAAGQIVKKSAETSYSLKLWTYDPGFVLFSSGGPGHPGRNRIVLIENDLDYYSRTSGEQGFLFKLRTPVKDRMVYESSFQVDNDRLEATKNIEGRLACRLALPQHTSITAYVRGRDKKGTGIGESRFYYGMYGRTDVLGNRKSSWRIEYGRKNKIREGRTNSLRLELLSTFEVNRHIRLVPRWRYVDPDLSKSGDGYFYLYITEVIAPAKNWETELIVVVKGYEDSGKDTYADVRVRMTWRL